MKKFLFYYCLWAIFLMTGCKDSSEGIDDPAYNFSVSPASINVDAQGGKQSISVSATSEWDVNCDASWVHLDSHAGSKNKTVSIDIEPNKSTEKRNTTLVVKEYKNGGTQTVSISQDGMAYSLSVDPESLLFANTETKGKTITVKSNDDWTVECSDSWIKTDKKEGSGNGSFGVSITGENNDTSVRQGSITVKGKNSKNSATIKVEQSAAGFEIKVDPKKWNLSSSDADSKVFKVSTNDSWTVESNNTWISIKKGSESGTGDGNFTVEVKENNDTNSRSGSITLEGKNSGKINISVEQPAKGYNLKVNRNSFSVDANGGEKAVDVTSNDDWTVTVKVGNSDELWLSTSKSSGSKNGSFTITIKANDSSDSREGTITVKGTKSGITETITISQDGKTDYKLEVSPSIISTDYKRTEERIKVESNDDWTVSCKETWVKLDENEKRGSGNGSFIVTISERTKETEHQATIYVTGTQSGIERTISVTQSGKPSEPEPEPEPEPTGPTYVDLGLPSGKKWAICNLGANSPERNGSKYTWYEAVGNNYSTYTDLAFNEWGGNWRVPSYKDIKELIDNCSWLKTTKNGVDGFQGKSKTNGNTIFFPYCDSATDGYKHGTYWTSSIYDGSKNEVSDYNNFETVGVLYFDERNGAPDKIKDKSKDYLGHRNCIRPVYIE